MKRNTSTTWKASNKVSRDVSTIPAEIAAKYDLTTAGGWNKAVAEKKRAERMAKLRASLGY